MRKILVTPKENGENGREFVYRVLRENIMSLHLPPGSHLHEPKIAEMLSLSRTPVREAFFALRKEHLVEVYPQSGSIVSPIDLDVLREGVTMRLLLESAVLPRLFGNLDSNIIDRMSDNLIKQKSLLSGQDSKNAYRFLRLDDEFHRALYQAGRKEHVYRACKSLSSQFDRIRHLIIIDGAMDNETLYEEHKQLYIRLLTGTGDAIVPFYQSHLSAYTLHLPVLMTKYPQYFEKSEQRLSMEAKAHSSLRSAGIPPAIME